jgi:hypothetical protein
MMDVRHPTECTCFSWKPVFAGALTAIGLSFLLNLFSVAIGLSAFNSDTTGTETLVFGGLIATALGIVASMFAAGWLAGYIGNRYCTKRHLGAFYGFLAWCVALIITIFLAEYAEHYVSFYSHFISGTGNFTAAAIHNASGATVAVTNMSASKIVISSYILFVLFFLSAFACSFGGHCGMRYVDKEVV